MGLVLSREQVRRVDELAVGRYGIPSLILMENAGANAAAIVDRLYGPHARAFVACGPGNNGGDGCVIARHLHNRGWSVRLLITAEEARLTPDTALNLNIVRAMGIPLTVAVTADAQRAQVDSIRTEDVLLDALLGTGFSGEVRSPTAELIQAMNAAGKRAVVAVDVPSGLDCDTGVPSRASIRADRTITFIAAKPGLLTAQAAPFVGQMEVADIGAPRELIDEIASRGRHV